MKDIYLKVFTLFYFTCLTVTVNAQSFNWEWINTAQSPGGSNPNSTATDSNGNVYVTTYFRAPSITLGEQTILHPGYNQFKFLVLKYNSDGILQWIKSIGQDTFCSVEAMCIDSEGNLLISGSFRGSVSFDAITLDNLTPESVSTYIAKVNPDGNFMFVAQLLDEGTVDNATKVYDLAVDSNDNIYLCGSFQSPTLDFGFDVQLSSSGNFNYFLSRFNTNGQAIWADKITLNPGGVSLYTPELAIDNEDNVFMGGTLSPGSAQFGGFTLLNNLTTYDVFLAKYTPTGQVESAVKYGGGDWDMFDDIVSDNAGNIYMSGIFHSPQISFGDTVLTNSGFSDIFIIKYNSEDNVVWGKSISGSYAEEGSYLAADIESVFITGIFSSDNLTFDNIPYSSAFPQIGTSSNYNTFIAKFSNSGNFIWANTPSGLNSMLLNVSVSNNNIYLAGRFTEDISVGQFNLSSDHPEKNKMFISKISQDGLSTTNFVQSNFSIYPNPTSNLLHITGHTDIYYSITDITGRPINTGSASNATIDVSSLPSGMYFLNINNTTTKFIKK